MALKKNEIAKFKKRLEEMRAQLIIHQKAQRWSQDA